MYKHEIMRNPCREVAHGLDAVVAGTVAEGIVGKDGISSPGVCLSVAVVSGCGTAGRPNTMRNIH